MMGTYVVADGYDRRKAPVRYTVRDYTREEVLALVSGAEARFIARDGTLRRVKVNGRVRTWARSPDRLEVPCKYGMYEYGTFTWTGEALVTDVARMVKIVEEQA